MHTVELLDEALDAARALGYKIREEWLGDSFGGACQIKGQKWLFLDPTLSPRDKLDQVCAALRSEPAMTKVFMSPPLARLISMRRAA